MLWNSSFQFQAPLEKNIPPNVKLQYGLGLNAENMMYVQEADYYNLIWKWHRVC